MSRSLRGVAAEIAARHPERIVGERPTVRRRGKRRHEMNATEEEYALRVLRPALRRGEILRWRYEVIRLAIAEHRWYTPDFVVTLHPSRLWSVIEASEARRRRFSEAGLKLEQTQPTLVCVEVKGSWRAKNARDARTRMEVAASLNPEIRFFAATREGGVWIHEPV